MYGANNWERLFLPWKRIQEQIQIIGREEILQSVLL